MSDMGDHFNDLREDRKQQKAKFGIDCPGCREKFPRAQPSKLLPGWKCRTCGYVDARPKLPENPIVCDHCGGRGWIEGYPDNPPDRRTSDKIDGYDRDDTGLSPDY